MPLSSATHNENKSILKNIISDDSDAEVILYSDGSLVVNQESALLEEERIALNLTEVSSIAYHGGRYHDRLQYKLQNLVSAICGIFSLYTAPALAAGILYGDFGKVPTELLEFPALIALAYLIPALFWGYFDFRRGDLASPEHLEFIRHEGPTLQIKGSLPDGGMHEIGTVGVFLGTTFAFFVFIFWVVEQASYLADLILYGIFIIVALLVIRRLINYFTDGEKLATIDSLDVPNGITHMYFAAMSLGIINTNISLDDKFETGGMHNELEVIRSRLQRYEEVISSLVSADDIFSASSPSLGVLAIRITSEKLMKRACENVGIKWKPNARLTLDSYINRTIMSVP